MEKLKFYKCTGPGGIAHYDGKTRYVVGETLTVSDACPASTGACGRGLHVVKQLAHLKEYVEAGNLKTAEFYEVEVDSGDVIASDLTKTRVRSLRVVRRIYEEDLGVRRGTLGGLIGDGDGYGDGYGYGYGSGYGY